MITQTEKAIALTLFAFAAFALSDGLRKLMSIDYPIIDILFWQGALGLVLLCLAIPFIGGMNAVLDRKNIKWQIIRGGLIALNTTFSLTAISQVPIMDAYTIFFLTPFVTCLMGVFFLKETIGAFRMLSIGFGFIGALVAFRPGFEAVNPAYLYALICVFTFSFSNMVARHMGATKSLAAYAFWPFIVLIMGIIVYRGGDIPPMHDAQFLLYAVVIGFAYGAASLTIAYAFTLAPAAVIAPYQYIQIIFALGFGYFFFGHIPDSMKMLGALIIIASGLVMFARERMQKRRTEKNKRAVLEK